MSPDGDPGSSVAVAPVVLAELVRAAALGVAGVVGVGSAPRRPVATHGPGRRVDGVEVRRSPSEGQVAVHVTVAFGTRVPELAEDLRRQVVVAMSEATGTAQWRVDVHVADLSVTSGELGAGGP
ncbi:hypothetical protein BH23ACT2_BH23ACT2_16340 [soil metagenome]